MDKKEFIENIKKTIAYLPTDSKDKNKLLKRFSKDLDSLLASEREECAKIVEEVGYVRDYQSKLPLEIAKAIREGKE